MPDLNSPVSFLIALMIINGLLSIPFGYAANRSFLKLGKLPFGLALWSGVAMHGHAIMTFAVAWFDRGSLYPSNSLSVLGGAIICASGAYLIFLGRKAYGDQRRVYGLKEDELITSGIYKRSRNPQYVGYGLMFFGAAIASGSLVSFFFVAVFAAMVHAGVTLIEEPHLERIFGESYNKYRRQSGRYFQIHSANEKTYGR